MKTTEWYPANVNPVRAGWYEVQRFRGFGKSKMPRHMLQWTGDDWQYAHSFEMMSAGCHASMNAQDGDKWRGLTECSA